MLTSGDQMLPENKRYGAIEPYVYGLSKDLSRYCPIKVFSYGYGSEESRDFSIETYHFTPATMHAMQPLLANYLSFNQVLQNIYFLKNVLKVHRNRRINILHLHNSSSAPILPLVKAITGAPAVCSVHSFYRPVALLERFDKLLPVSEYLKRYLNLQKGISLKKIETLNIAINPQEWAPQRDKQTAKKILRLENKRIILFVGRKCPEKGPEVLLRALQSVIKTYPAALAILVGADFWHDSTNTSYTRYLLSEAQRLGIQKNVLFKMRLNDEVLKMFYEAADVFVVPSIWQEPFGKVIIEAMACEKPVVATSVGGIPEIVTHKKDGLLIKPNDAEILADAIMEVFRDNEFAYMLGINGRQTVEQRFSFPVVAKKCLEIYRTLTV